MNSVDFIPPDPQISLDMKEVQVDPHWALSIPASLALRQNVLPFASIDGRVMVACLDRRQVATLQAVERYCGLSAVPIEAEEDSLKAEIQRIFGGNLGSRVSAGAEMRSIYQNLKSAAEPNPDDLIPVCDDLLHSAIVRRASDMHLSPQEHDLRVRLRVNGTLETFRTLPKQIQNPLISRLKVLSGLDIAERRSAQDGRFSLDLGDGGSVDVRVACIPTRFGERMTLRFLPKRPDLQLDNLGMSTDGRKIFEQAIDKPYGLILLTGPTGSGKSTTLYAAIRKLIQEKSINVLTIEDPVEYDIEGVDQVEVDTGDRINFSKALRSMLRHDPDVVMLGEIRDQESASVAIKSALTGHLVFSTLHTNSAINAVTRLIDMGIEPYLVGATLRLTVAQRLVRRICRKCAAPVPLSTHQALALGSADLEGADSYLAPGCMYCAGSGVVGQIGLFELIPVERELAAEISRGATEEKLLDIVERRKFPLLAEDAVQKVTSGQISAAEAVRAVSIW